jgi:hypothetical protein
MHKDKIERLESRGEKSSFTVSRGTVELKSMREMTHRQSSQSKTPEIVSCYDQYQILKPNGKRKEGSASEFLSKHQKGHRRKLL